jgi:hypothetical protein
LHALYAFPEWAEGSLQAEIKALIEKDRSMDMVLKVLFVYMVKS